MRVRTTQAKTTKPTQDQVLPKPRDTQGVEHSYQKGKKNTTTTQARLEVRSESGYVLHQAEQNVRVKSPLVGLVDHHDAVAPEVWLRQQLTQEHAVCHVLPKTQKEDKYCIFVIPRVLDVGRYTFRNNQLWTHQLESHKRKAIHEFYPSAFLMRCLP